MIGWLGIDFYWSTVIRVYKDSKKGIHGQQAAERIYNRVDPNSFLYDQETTFNASMQ